MTEIEQEMLRRVLVNLFLASPRKRTQLPQKDSGEKTQEKTLAASKVRKQHSGGNEGDH